MTEFSPSIPDLPERLQPLWNQLHSTVLAHPEMEMLLFELSPALAFTQSDIELLSNRLLMLSRRFVLKEGSLLTQTIVSIVRYEKAKHQLLVYISPHYLKLP